MRARFFAGALAAGLLVPTTIATAATLGGLSMASLVSVNQTASAGTPTVIGCDNFTGTTGATISVRSATAAGSCSNRVWTVHVGTWTIQSNTAASSATTDAAATENTTSVNCTARVVLTNLNTLGRTGGLAISHNGTSTYLAAVMIDATPDRVELRWYNTGVATVLATYNPTFATSNALQLSRNGTTITTSLNGASLGTFTLTSAQQTSLGTAARAGLYGGNGSVRFDDFAVTTP